jgi:hypothetical protein
VLCGFSMRAERRFGVWPDDFRDERRESLEEAIWTRTSSIRASVLESVAMLNEVFCRGGCVWVMAKKAEE